MAAIEEGKQETNFFERAIFVITPILFVIVLIGVIVLMVDKGVRNQAIEVARDIPVIGSLLPDRDESVSSSSDQEMRSEKFTERIVELESKLATLEEELTISEAKTLEQEQLIASLKETATMEEENNSVKAATSEETADSEQYTARIQELANMFSKMTPSKAAPIVQSMTLEEMALILNQMRSEERAKIMEKMNPNTAADVAIMLKDSVKAEDLEIAALQSRIEKLQTAASEGNTTTEVSDVELAATFSAMDPSSAADMLLKMMDISSSKVLRILNVTDSNARSAILEEMNAKNETTTALLVTKLMKN